MRKAFVETLTEAARADRRIMLLSADTGFHALESFREAHPDRYLNCGISEAATIGLAAGLAIEGYRPFVYGIVPFVTLRCLEHIRNDLCGMGLPVTIVGVGAGLAYGSAGASHHATDDLAVMRAMPGMTVVGPADPDESTRLTELLTTLDAPAYMRLDKSSRRLPHVEDLAGLEIGRALTLRSGKDVALLTTGPIAAVVLEAAERLADGGLDPEVVALPTLKPLDTGAIEGRARCCRLLVTIEEHGLIGGLGAAVAETIADAGATVRLRRLGAADRFERRAGSQAFLRAENGLDVDGIVAAVKGALADV